MRRADAIWRHVSLTLYTKKVHSTLRIVIIGAGAVGSELSRVLSEEHHDVVVMDLDGEALKRIAEHHDVLTVEGNGTSPTALVEASVQEAEVLIAVTDVDEINIIASMMGRRLGARLVIARVRNDELSREDSPLSPSELGIDILIHPELSAAKEIVQLIKRAAASDIVSLADGRLQLIGLRLEEDSPFVGKTLEEAVRFMDGVAFRVIAIARRGQTIIPRGTNALAARDYLYVFCKTEDVDHIVEATGHKDEQFRNVMIAGGTAVGERVARLLSEDERRWDVKLIEPDRARAIELSEEFKSVLVLNGNPTDPNLLATEGIHEMDAFIAVTPDEESNIISALMAKHLRVRKTLAMVSKPGYIPLIQAVGLDAAVNAKASASDEIHRHVRKGQLLTVKALRGIKGEVFEVVASHRCQIADTPVQKLDLPTGTVLGGIVRYGQVEIVTGTSVIRRGDRVIVFALHSAIDEVVRLFQ